MLTTEHPDLESVKNYYGKVLSTKDDLKTSACCTADSFPVHLRPILSEIHPEVQDRFYGCGSPLPSALEGATVLDLGSGSGRDCFILSKLVGSEGRVIGVDMTDEQLDVARRHVDYHTRKFGYAKPNVDFRQGYIEDLATAGIDDNSIDVVVSNCVVNLSPDKARVFAEILRVLKPGGELYFSDVFSGRRVPENLRHDPVLLGECLGGALYTEDFRRMLADLGCADFRVLAKTPITLNSPEIEAKAGMIDFYSITVRAFKLALEDRCEDYGQVAYYKGMIADQPHAFVLDDHHRFEKDRPLSVCGNTADMLAQSRYGKHFRIEGDKSTHFGLFDCGPAPSAPGTAIAGACC